MMQRDFAEKMVKIAILDERVAGLAVQGDWHTGNMDEYSNLELIWVTWNPIDGDRETIEDIARKPGHLVSCSQSAKKNGIQSILTCLYDSPLLQVDFHFCTPVDFYHRTLNPEILFEREGVLSKIMNISVPHEERLDYQDIENKAWILFYSAANELAKGEIYTAVDLLNQLRSKALLPLAHRKNQATLPHNPCTIKGLDETARKSMAATLPGNNTRSIATALKNAIALYKDLRIDLFPKEIVRNQRTESIVQLFLLEARWKLLDDEIQEST